MCEPYEHNVRKYPTKITTKNREKNKINIESLCSQFKTKQKEEERKMMICFMHMSVVHTFDYLNRYQSVVHRWFERCVCCDCLLSIFSFLTFSFGRFRCHSKWISIIITTTKIFLFKKSKKIHTISSESKMKTISSSEHIQHWFSMDNKNSNHQQWLNINIIIRQFFFFFVVFVFRLNVFCKNLCGTCCVVYLINFRSWTGFLVYDLFLSLLNHKLSSSN